MKWNILALFLATSALHSEISNEQYKKMEQYLASLPENTFPPSTYERVKLGFLNIKLVGDSGESPIFDILYLNGRPEDKKNCIVLYVTYNSPYPDYVYRAVEDLKKMGFDGHVLYRIGGYPNAEKGALKFIDVPYAFKVCALWEAASLGYRNILWVDSSLRPIKKLEPLFEIIEKDGYFAMSAGGNSVKDEIDKGQVDRSILPYLGITYDQSAVIHHVTGTFFGINVQSHIGRNILLSMYKMAEVKRGFYSYWVEEMPLSVTLANLKLSVKGYWWQFYQKDWEVDEKITTPYFLMTRKRPNWRS